MSSTQVLQSQDGGPTFAPRNRIRNEDHRNWIRCNLGLQEIADATRQHVYQTFRTYWNSDFWWSCHNRCDGSECKKSFAHCHCESNVHSCTYWLDHNHPENLYCPIKRREDTWYIYTKQNCKACADQFGKVLSLFHDPKSMKIYWKNVKFPIRNKGPWEIAKAFMPQGNRLADSPDQAEGIALLNVINTCKLLDKHGGFDHTAIDQLVRKRNELTHSASHELPSSETDEIFDMMIKLLEKLNSTCQCPAQLKNLRELRGMELTGELIDKAFAKSVQALMNEISDRLAAGEEASHLMECLKSTIEMQKQHSVTAQYEVEVDKFKKVLAKENEDLKTQLRLKDENMHKLETNLNGLKEKNKKADQKKEIVLKNKTIQDLETKVQDLQEENEKIRLQFEGLQKENLMKKETIQKLQSSLHELQLENEKMRQEQMKEMLLKNETIKRLETELNELKAENEKMQQEQMKEMLLKNETIKRLETELNEFKAEKEKMRQEQTKKIFLKNEAIKRLETELYELQAEILLKNETIQILETKLCELKAENEKMQQEQITEMLLKNETIKRLETELYELREETIIKIETIKKLETDLNELKKENEKLRLHLQNKTPEVIKRLETSLLELQKEIEKMKNQLQDQEKEKLRLKVDIEDKVAENKRLKETVDNQVLEIQNLTNEKENLKKLSTEQRRKLKEIVHKMETVSAEKIRLVWMIYDLQTEVASKELEINQLNRSNNERANEIRSVSDALVVSNIFTVIITVFLMRIVMILH